MRRRVIVYSGKMRFALLLFSPLSRLVCRTKRAFYARGILRALKSPIPVISVGNIAFGGSGKTPLAVEIAADLLAGGEKPALVSRGYKGAWEKRGGVLSDGREIRGTWREGGDEPFMAARQVPGAGVFVGKDRLASCRKAAELGFSCAVLDDGFQHLRLARDVEIVLVDPQEKQALRESPISLRRADFILVRKTEGSINKEKIAASFPAAAVSEFWTEARGFASLNQDGTLPRDAFRGRRVLAFCGIARPRRFFSLLEDCEAKIAGMLSFPDHYSYPEKAIGRIADAARAAGAEAVITTEKDAVKIILAGSPLESLRVFYLKIGCGLEPGFREGLRAAFKTAKGSCGGRP
jgi:tetraacyldisaccharide 4'-kinase